MYLAIDGRKLIREPHQVEIVPYDHETGLTADQRPIVRPSNDYFTINCTWGDNATYQDVLCELDRLRANRGVHALTFEPLRGGRRLTINAFMGKPRQTHLRQGSCGKFIVSSFTIPFVQVDTPTYLYRMLWRLEGIISVGAPYIRHEAPAAGRIIAVDGYIRDLGAGGGPTTVQISNGATNYLSTPGDFIPNAIPLIFRLQNAVLAANTDFAQGDPIDLDVTAIPGGGLSKDAVVWTWNWIYRP